MIYIDVDKDIREMRREINKFDNRAFTAWLLKFEAALVEYGRSEEFAKKYRHQRFGDAFSRYMTGASAEDAAMELVVTCNEYGEAALYPQGM